MPVPVSAIVASMAVSDVSCTQQALQRDVEQLSITSRQAYVTSHSKAFSLHLADSRLPLGYCPRGQDMLSHFYTTQVVAGIVRQRG